MYHIYNSFIIYIFSICISNQLCLTVSQTKVWLQNKKNLPLSLSQEKESDLYLFWNQILICRSVRHSACAISILLRRVRYLKQYTVCSRSSDPFCIVTYYIKWVTTSWTDGRIYDDIIVEQRQYICISIKLIPMSVSH